LPCLREIQTMTTRGAGLEKNRFLRNPRDPRSPAKRLVCTPLSLTGMG